MPPVPHALILPTIWTACGLHGVFVILYGIIGTRVNSLRSSGRAPSGAPEFSVFTNGRSFDAFVFIFFEKPNDKALARLTLSARIIFTTEVGLILGLIVWHWLSM